MKNLLITVLALLCSRGLCFRPICVVPSICKAEPSANSSFLRTRPQFSKRKALSLSLVSKNDIDKGYPQKPNIAIFGFFCTVSIFYWYLMVLGAAAKVNGLPVPDFIPMVPGWPATEADFQDVLDDSYNFFYLSELLHNDDAPYVSPPRLSVFNFVEAWVFAYLPALWKDPKRLPRAALLGSWAILGINLTNAFLAPYLAVTELSVPSNGKVVPKNLAFSIAFGAMASLVVAYAVFQSSFVATRSDWKEFFELAASNRTYLAFCLDPVFLAAFQPLVLARVNGGESKPLDYVPFVGLVAWLFSSDENIE